jgi:hypothetical protein
MMTKIMMKSWLNHSESRSENGNSPYTFDIYVRYKYAGLKI